MAALKVRLKAARRVVWTAAIAAGALIDVPGIMNPTNLAQTSLDHLDPNLRTRRYAASLPHIRDKVRAIIPALRTYGRPWRIVYPAGNELIPIDKAGGPLNAGFEGRVLKVHAAVPVLFFVDDLVVTLRAEAGATSVEVRSKSRVGKGDLGENRRHILQLLSALDREMQK